MYVETCGINLKGLTVKIQKSNFELLYLKACWLILCLPRSAESNCDSYPRGIAISLSDLAGDLFSVFRRLK